MEIAGFAVDEEALRVAVMLQVFHAISFFGFCAIYYGLYFVPAFNRYHIRFAFFFFSCFYFLFLIFLCDAM